MTAVDIAPLNVPLTRLPDGTLRVTGTRIPLDRVIESYKHGATPEAIVDSFDSLKLADVYAIISYYLNHTEEVEAYLSAREREAEEIRRQIEASQPPLPAELRERIRAARARMEAERNAAAGQ
ncbi:MAG TPA: DUF433 domain-containing protein [Gemmataceae bacterium]|jgi:uncharacterized protein (DUF433 family)